MCLFDHINVVKLIGLIPESFEIITEMCDLGALDLYLKNLLEKIPNEKKK